MYWVCQKKKPLLSVRCFSLSPFVVKSVLSENFEVFKNQQLGFFPPITIRDGINVYV